MTHEEGLREGATRKKGPMKDVPFPSDTPSPYGVYHTFLDPPFRIVPFSMPGPKPPRTHNARHETKGTKNTRGAVCAAGSESTTPPF